MLIRRAEEKDIDRINELLYQVHKVHSDGRPDIFTPGTKKYTSEELIEILKDDMRPVYVVVDEKDYVMGYAFCIYEEVKNCGGLADMKSLYIDDLCVDECCRGKSIGTALYEHVVEEAKKSECYRITLNVWCLNESAMRFYKKCGLQPLKIVMEQVL